MGKYRARDLLQKRLLILLLVTCFGCGNFFKNDPKDPHTLKVGLLTLGPVNDSGWNAMAMRSLSKVEKDLHAVVYQYEARGSQIRDGLRSYAHKGYNLVIGHGFEYNEPAIQVAKEFPNTYFLTTAGFKTSKNVATIHFFLEEACFLAGVLAGEITKTNCVGMIGGPKVPSIASTFLAFKSGVLSVKPDCKVIEIFTGQESDVAAAQQATFQAINTGADIIIHEANSAAQGVFDACKAKKVLAIGTNSNQNNNSSGVVLASALINADNLFLEFSKMAKNQTFEGKVYIYGMKENAIDLVFNPALKNLVPLSVINKLNRLKVDIKNKKIHVPYLKY